MEFQSEKIHDIVITDKKGYERCAQPILDVERKGIYKSRFAQQTESKS